MQFFRFINPVPPPEEDEQGVSPRGYFWIGYAVGVTNAVVIVAVVLIARALH